MGLSEFYDEMVEHEEVAQAEREELEKTAALYDHMGREFYKASMPMADATSEYGVGSKVKEYAGGFTNLVKKLLGRLKKGGKLKETGQLKGAKRYRRRRK
jgi:altronate dehydratase